MGSAGRLRGMRGAILLLSFLLLLLTGLPDALRAGNRVEVPASIPPDLESECLGENPYLVTSCFVSSSQLTGPQLDEAPAVIAFRDTPSDVPQYLLATHGQVGSIFGLAYAQREPALYAAAFHKRQVRFGPGGPAAIYRIDMASLDVTQAITVPNVGPDRHDRSLRTSDANAGPGAGKTSLGDIDLSEDGSELFVVNLDDRQIYRFGLPEGRLLGQFATGGLDQPWAEDARPFGLLVRAGRVYHGVVHTAQASRRQSDLMAHVYASQPDGSQMREVARTPLRGNRGQIQSPQVGAGGRLDWQAWTDQQRGFSEELLVSIFPMPLLTDIELTADDSLIIGLRDRNMDRGPMGGVQQNQYPSLGAGDILRGLRNDASWIFFQPDEHFQDRSQNADETVQGGLASIWSLELVVAGAAPMNANGVAVDQDGALWFGVSDGAPHRSEQFCNYLGGVQPRVLAQPASPQHSEGLGIQTMGDLELLCSRPFTPSATPSPSPSPTTRPSPTPSPRPTGTPTPNPTPSPSPSPSPSQTATPEPTPIFLPILLLQPDCARIPVSVALVLDASTSMREATRAGRPKAEAAVEAARSFLDALRLPEDRASIVAFNAEASLLAPLTGDRGALDEALARFELAQFTRIDLGIEAARRELVEAAGEGETQAMVVLTDGRNNPEPVSSAVDAAARAKADSIRVFTIGLGSEIEEAALREMASGPADYRAAADGEDLAGIYQALAGAVRLCPGQWRP